MEQWRQNALAQRGQYEDHVREQINRSFQEYTPPWYASVIGFRRDWNLLVATSRVSGFASTLGRDLEDTETKAIAEYTLNNIHSNAAFKWATIGLAAYMTYRGRHTWQFPFYKPKLGGRFNPNEATSIFNNKKIRGAYPRFTWHTLRFTAYAAVTMLMVEPVFRAVNYIRTETKMANDPRLERFMKEAASKVKKVMSDGPSGGDPRQRRQAEPTDSSDSYTQDEAQEETNGDRSALPAMQHSADYYRMHDRMRDTAQSQTSQQSGDDWNVLDEEDGASPIAAPVRNQSTTTAPAGSSWERLRQQSRSGQQTQEQSEFTSRGGWASVGRAQPQSQSESQSGWGSESSSSSEWAGSRDSYTYNSADEERALAKEQAQKEFDEMLEKERNGDQQGRSWGRR